MTPEQQKDKAAYEACGYTITPYTDGFGGMRATHPDGTRFVLGYPALSWSSTNAAIEHAERGGFEWEVGCTAHESPQRPDRRRYARIGYKHNGITYWYAGWGHSDSPGIAIRNAILGLATKGAE